MSYASDALIDSLQRENRELRERLEVGDSSFGEWLRNFQREHDELRTIGAEELRELAHALTDDCPVGYEASHRLAQWLLCATTEHQVKSDDGMVYVVVQLCTEAKYSRQTFITSVQPCVPYVTTNGDLAYQLMHEKRKNGVDCFVSENYFYREDG